jgi:hypothetical protein
MVVYAYNPSPREADDCKFEVSLDYIVRLTKKKAVFIIGKSGSFMHITLRNLQKTIRISVFCKVAV